MITHAALVFVDWDSARRIANVGRTALGSRRPDREIEDAIEALQSEVANLTDDGTIIRISWRIYHGWHEGTNPTSDRRLFEDFINRYSSRRIGRVAFGRDFTFGDQMLCGSPRSPLRYTLRPRPGLPPTVRGQKMVDTALVADLLHAARTAAYDRLIVIGDDDDLLPGLFAAESWGAKVRLLRLKNTSGLPLLKGREKGFPLTIMSTRETTI